MNKENNGIPAISRLRYKKGEQIFKQNDFGISIYKILNGKIEIFRESEDTEIPVAVLGGGDVIGEMIFFLRSPEARTASARALETSELEAWHPIYLIREYEKASPVLRLIINQSLNRLLRMDDLLDRLYIEKKDKEEKLKEETAPQKSRRRFYRKKVNMPCTYSPLQTPKGCHNATLRGYIKDISMTGMGLEIDPRNESVTPHGIGDLFKIHTVLPNGKDLDLTAEIVFINKRRAKIRLGMSFPDPPDHTQDARKTLGFFLLPA